MKNNNTLSPCFRVLMKSFPLIIWWYMHSSLCVLVFFGFLNTIFWRIPLSLFIFVIVIVIFLGQSVEGERCSEVKPMWRQGQPTTLGTTCPKLFNTCVGSLMSPDNNVTLKIQETGPMVYSPYPRRLHQTNIAEWYNYKGSTFLSVIWINRVLIQSGVPTLELPHSRLVLYQLS